MRATSLGKGIIRLCWPWASWILVLVYERCLENQHPLPSVRFQRQRRGRKQEGTRVWPEQKRQGYVYYHTQWGAASLPQEMEGSAKRTSWPGLFGEAWEWGSSWCSCGGSMALYHPAPRLGVGYHTRNRKPVISWEAEFVHSSPDPYTRPQATPCLSLVPYTWFELAHCSGNSKGELRFI